MKTDFLSSYLEDILVTHIEPGDDVKNVHNVMVDQLIDYLQENLPQQHWIFKDCKVKMFGSVGSNTKICEMDEYDINVVPST